MLSARLKGWYLEQTVIPPNYEVPGRYARNAVSMVPSRLDFFPNSLKNAYSLIRGNISFAFALKGRSNPACMIKFESAAITQFRASIIAMSCSCAAFVSDESLSVLIARVSIEDSKSDRPIII